MSCPIHAANLEALCDLMLEAADEFVDAASAARMEGDSALMRAQMRADEALCRAIEAVRDARDTRILAGRA